MAMLESKGKNILDYIYTVIINYQTSDLLRVAVESFRSFYPDVDLLIVDNGSKDNSPDLIKVLIKQFPEKTQALFLNKNIYHGPAMDKALNVLNKNYIFFLDSDTMTKRGGFLEKMFEEFKLSENIYGVGRQITVNKRGFPSEKGIVIIAPAYMMIRRDIYLTLSPFEHHGQPVLKNFISAYEKGYVLGSFPIENYIEHTWRGTASRFGYGLGLRGKIDFILNKLGF